MEIIKNIWYGNLEPQDLTDEDIEKANELSEKVNSCYENLVEKLSKESQKLLDEYISSFEQYNCFLEEKAFESGFKLVVQAIVESLGD